MFGRRKGESPLAHSTCLGIDAGGTLVKFAYEKQGTLAFHKIPSARMDTAAAWIQEHFPDAQLCITGGKSSLLQSLLQRSAHTIVEFEATCLGAQHLLEGQEKTAQGYILTNVGTGTSIHCVQGTEHRRIGGTGVGGGTIVGLSWLLTGRSDFKEIVELSRQGERDRIDLKVSHIYEGMEPPIPGDLTASNFGHVLQDTGPKRAEDMLASVIGLVGETVSSVSVHAAGQCGVESVVYIGTSFVDNELLREVVARYTRLRGSEPVFMTNGEFSGAIGALLSNFT
ncbi:type II pantothenate kinase [Paenibacillus cremeus]|uniref:Type II pantothenate kinase n=1 Tax=Paenibacillus cremeus TaxID=2163881 RepID=A0A559KEK9_9BACL|nr:type II pantothenate kinase [Paenibacillus cremeus]TVY10557.1 type II pantothenate kinase [Paenibacillus cremeus]